MSAVSSKSRLVLFLLVVIAAFTNNVNNSNEQAATQVTCTIVQTGEEKMFGECATS